MRHAGVIRHEQIEVRDHSSQGAEIRPAGEVERRESHQAANGFPEIIFVVVSGEHDAGVALTRQRISKYGESLRRPATPWVLCSKVKTNNGSLRRRQLVKQ